jgi:hypothetical protein
MNYWYLLDMLNLTRPRNMTLGRLIAMWCLLGIYVPPFDYIKIDGRKMINYEFNVETFDFWPWEKNQMFNLSIQ